MFDTHELVLYKVLSKRYYESLDSYNPGNEYYRIVSRRLPRDWTLRVRGMWTYAYPPRANQLECGWKIHLSITPTDATELLRTALPALIAKHIYFKFFSDEYILRLSLNKNWPRTQSGKFITAYPKDQSEFVDVIEVLYQTIGPLFGPYVLTDRQYKDSKVIFYRYGEHTGSPRPNHLGELVRGFHLPDGSWYEDKREPRFTLPPGVHDPFAADGGPAPIHGESVLLKGRYSVKGAYKFNATGGVYYGLDKATEREVVIRELRAGFPPPNGHDNKFPTLLHKEAHVLRRLGSTGYTPKFVDIFQEWSHWFLVEERLTDVESLWGYSMNFYFGRRGMTNVEALRLLRDAAVKIARGLECVHQHGIVLRDLTRSNVLVRGGNFFFIDFEFAYEKDSGERWVAGGTPGYISAEQQRNYKPSFADDCYAFGALLLDLITFSADGLQLDRKGIYAALRQTILDLGLPGQLNDIVVGLTRKERFKRWNIARAVAALEVLPTPRVQRPLRTVGEDLDDPGQPAEHLREDVDVSACGIADYICTAAEFFRRDRLWPASAELFLTNPINLEYGAAGTALFLLRRYGQVDPRILTWIESRWRFGHYSGGLYSGLAGPALLLLWEGRVGSAASMLAAAWESETTNNSPGLYYGSAGVGLTDLYFWHATGDSKYLDHARRIGDSLISTAERSPNGIYWRSSKGRTYLGLAMGQAGISLFLLTLGVASGDCKFINAALRAVDFDISHAVDISGLSLWPPYVDAEANEPNSPFTWHGSAGVGAVCLRCYVVTKRTKYLTEARRCAYASGSRITNKMWQDYGLAGAGEFLLDMSYWLGESKYRNVAFQHAEMILLHKIECPEGTAFAGMNFARICCDFGQGSAGIGVFLQRLLDGRARTLMADELLVGSMPTGMSDLTTPN